MCSARIVNPYEELRDSHYGTRLLGTYFSVLLAAALKRLYRRHQNSTSAGQQKPAYQKRHHSRFLTISTVHSPSLNTISSVCPLRMSLF